MNKFQQLKAICTNNGLKLRFEIRRKPNRIMCHIYNDNNLMIGWLGCNRHFDQALDILVDSLTAIVKRKP